MEERELLEQEMRQVWTRIKQVQALLDPLRKELFTLQEKHKKLSARYEELQRKSVKITVVKPPRVEKPKKVESELLDILRGLTQAELQKICQTIHNQANPDDATEMDPIQLDDAFSA
jgi:cell division septum initiation protein DivIVA